MVCCVRRPEYREALYHLPKEELVNLAIRLQGERQQARKALEELRPAMQQAMQAVENLVFEAMVKNMRALKRAQDRMRRENFNTQAATLKLRGEVQGLARSMEEALQCTRGSLGSHVKASSSRNAHGS